MASKLELPSVLSIPALNTSADKVVISEQAADETLRLVEDHGSDFGPLTPEGEAKLRRKLQWFVVPLVGIINILLFIDKSTLSYGVFLGLYDSTGIDDTKYNNLSTIFYAGYIVGQLPGSYLIQRLPLGKFVAGSIFMWAVITFLHCVAHNYGGLIVLRFLLGFFESALVPAFEMTLNMFFPPEENLRLQPLFWISCVAAPIPAGFIAYGLLWSASAVNPWKLFMVILGGVTLLLSVITLFIYPDNPAKARFLTLEEKLHAIRRVHAATKSSIEQKTFKPHQLREALRDPVSWLFLLAAFCLMLANNLTFQSNLLYLKLGVGDLGSTLVSAVGGVFAALCGLLAWLGMKYFPQRSAFWGTFWCLPAIAGGIGMVALPWYKTLSLLAVLTLAGNTFGNTYIIALGWTSASAGGYTKKLVRNVMWMAGYGVSNLISPQIWVAKDSPRYYGAWIAQILISWVGTPVCLWIIHWILSKRNKERREWITEQERLGKRPVGIVEQADQHGNLVKVEVDICLLDLTDWENKYFIYQL